MRNRADRHHLVVLAAHIKIEQIVRLQAGPRLGLHIDLQRKPELVELVDVSRSEIGAQCGEDVADRDAQRLRPVAIHGHGDVRSAGTESRQDVLQPFVGIGFLDDLVGDLAEPSIVEAPAQQLHLHLQSAGIADALDRRRRQHEEPAVRSAVERIL